MSIDGGNSGSGKITASITSCAILTTGFYPTSPLQVQIRSINYEIQPPAFTYENICGTVTKTIEFVDVPDPSSVAAVADSDSKVTLNPVAPISGTPFIIRYRETVEFKGIASYLDSGNMDLVIEYIDDCPTTILRDGSFKFDAMSTSVLLPLEQSIDISNRV